MSTAYHPWGRVDPDGTVYVRTADGERVIGSWQAGSPEEALAFYQRKYEALETEVVLLEQRISATDMAPAQAAATVQRLISNIRSWSARVNKNWRSLIAAMSWQFIQSLRRSSD